jgi:hypothetical protein
MATKTIELFNVTSRTTTVTGDAKSLAFGGSEPITQTVTAANSKLGVGIALTTIAGSGTVDFSVEGNFGGEWITLTPSAAWSAVTTGTSEQYRTFVGPVPVEVRGMATVAGTITFAAEAVAIGVDS